MEVTALQGHPYRSKEIRIMAENLFILVKRRQELLASGEVNPDNLYII
jgi:hypothetical protein